ncbi:MAG TPA: hypothetical protein VLA83_20035, partial [Candidatus Binatia bacterium]|nr:hypothetical protein [Candidatus Binatia bacterium]
MNNRNPVESFCCPSCRVPKGFLRANYRCFWLLALLLVWGHLSCMAQQPAAKPSTPRIHEEVLAEISGRGKLVDVFVSHQGEMVWIELYPDYTQAVLLNGKLMGDYYNEVKYVAESPDGKLWAFTVRRKSKWVLIINGQVRTGEYDEMLSPDITNDGHFLVPARKDGKWRMVADGKDGAEFEKLASGAVFDPSGTHYAWMAMRHGKWITLKDGKELGGELEGYYRPQWFNGHVVVAGQNNGKWHWLIDGEPGPGFDVISQFTSTPDGKHYAYSGSSGASGHQVSGSIVVDGKIVASYSGAQLRGGWLAAEGLKEGVRRLHPAVHGVSDPVLSEDGAVFYAARRGEKDFAVFANGVAGPAFEDIVSPVAVTADGRHFAYVAKRGDSFIEIRDHKTGPSFPSKATLSLVPWIRLSRDGAHLAYEIDRGGHTFKAGVGDMAWRRVVVDGQS